ncbi:thioredoxin fold domain-containing protein [Pleionea sp. CnH1-48]|uniref:thioredoxin fold domain-containing protein n=1 Tax=Pleionea sp. CnH1-48 TaxID=2954494 RepID=UPI002097CE4E|nr:thioredoxin fold domain-containing protein [Pleionea sp. CnH1-48]MCO7224172.1 thioredoxin fold domain-containing protein [Pleionea sp. CnH1-48]
MKRVLSLLLGSSMILGVATAAESTAENQIRSVLGNPPNLIIESYNSDLLKVSLGHQVFFATQDGSYLFGGPVIDTKKQLNLVEVEKQTLRKQAISDLSSSMTLSFPANKEEHVVTVFTDIDCTYCRKLHTQMADFNALGISVNYVMLPRSGVGSQSYLKAVSVFCSENPRKSMDKAMAGQAVDRASCDNTVADQFKTAVSMGINSTPVMILPDGQLQMGLIKPEQLKKRLTSS